MKIVKSFSSLLVVIAILFAMAAPAFATECFSPYHGTSPSIVDGLNAVGSPSDFAYRSEIAMANGISNYSGSAKQNSELLRLLKAGQLRCPDGADTPTGNQQQCNTFGEFYPSYHGSSNSIADALASLGVRNDFAFRCQIAAKNNIGNGSYSGSAAQNLQMLDMLRSSNLKNPEYRGAPAKEETAKPSAAETAIYNFAKKKNTATSYFINFNEPAIKFTNDISAIDSVTTWFFRRFDVFEDNAFSLDKNYKAQILENVITSVMSTVMENERARSGEYLSAAANDLSTAMSISKSVGEGFKNYANTHRRTNGRLILDMRTKTGRRYKSTVKALDNYATWLNGISIAADAGDAVYEFILDTYYDYEQGIYILESLKENVSNKEVCACIDGILAAYNKEFDTIFAKYLGKTAKIVSDTGVFLAANPALDAVLLIRGGIDLAGHYTSLGKQARARLDACAYSIVQHEFALAYQSSIEKLSKMSETDDNFSDAVADVQVTFEVAKVATQQMFNMMAQASAKSEAKYYKYCAKQASKLSMESDAPTILSYEAWVKKNKK